MPQPDRQLDAEARAHTFDLAWETCYAPGHDKLLPEDIARTAFAKHLVATAREGVVDEAVLALSGFVHLTSLTSRRGSEP